MTDRLRIVLTGLIAQYPLGGVAWDYLQYVIGFDRLGHDVLYIEDTNQWPYNPTEDGTGTDAEHNVAHLHGLMNRFGLGDRWAYRFPWQDQWFGMPANRRREVLATADLVVNVSGVLADLSGVGARARRVFIDSDPAFTQVKLDRGQTDFERHVDAHDVHMTFGETLGEGVPDTGHRWIPTRQPVVLDLWAPRPGEPSAPAREAFTTVMNWTSYKPVRHGGRTYGQKDLELIRFMELPGLVPDAQLELAIASGKVKRTPTAMLRHHGWQLADPMEVAPDFDSYRSYIRDSAAEWSVAKNGYVTGRTGWFSCRSACYLAAGRPVVVQDTGFSDLIPTGAGVHAFDDLDGAVSGIQAVLADPVGERRAAREVAAAHFDARVVLAQLIEDAGAAPS